MRYVYVRADTLEPGERFIFKDQPHALDEAGVLVRTIGYAGNLVTINDTLVLPADTLVALAKEEH